jgi:hypothetical protein
MRRPRAALLALTLVGCGQGANDVPAPDDPGGEGGHAQGGGGAGGAHASGGGPGAGGHDAASAGGHDATGAGGSSSGGAPAGGTGGEAPADAGAGGAASPADAAPAADASSHGLVKIFDGSGWDNWEYDAKAWTIVGGAMHGHLAGGQSQAFTKQDYASFRLIVWSRMTAGNDHLGICLWGGRPAAGKYGFVKCLLVIPPNAAIWDYLDNTDHPKPDYQKGMETWHETEILANQLTGRVLVAVNGKLIHDYQDPPDHLARRKNGPIGMQIHKAGAPEVEYKDIAIEVDPTSDKLITLVP